MIEEKQRLIDVMAAKLSARRNEYRREADNIGVVMGNCLAAEEIIIECKELLEVVYNAGVYSKFTAVGLNAKSVLDDIDYFLNKEADNEN